jgi:hypothetical protein
MYALRARRVENPHSYVPVIARYEAISSPDTEREGTKAERHEEKPNTDDADEHGFFVIDGFTPSEAVNKTCKS